MEIQVWKRLLTPYYQAVEELTIKFEHLVREHRMEGSYSPIESVKGRVKSVTSILEKMERKGIPFERMEQDVEDIAGIRLICRFQEDVEIVAEHIRNRSDLELVEVKDYISAPKDSGYRSYHLIVYYNVESYRGTKKVQVEIQIRTMAMNFWATTEHSLQYKYNGDLPQHLAHKLSKAAEVVEALDNVMSSVRSELMDAQMNSQIEQNLVSDILRTIDNLFSKTTEREVKKIQDEFFRVFSLHDIDELKRFHKELDTLAEGYHAQGAEDYGYEYTVHKI